MKKISLLAVVLGVGLFASVARAQDGGGFGGGEGTGCNTSPENPTAILALAGSTGAGLAVLRARIGARRAKKRQA